MTHILFIFYFFTANFNTQYISNINQIFLGFGALVFVYLVSLPVSVLFEAPFMNLEKTFLMKKELGKFDKI